MLMLSLYQKTEGAKQMEKRVTVGCPVGGARHNAENSLDRLTADTYVKHSVHDQYLPISLAYYYDRAHYYIHSPISHHTNIIM